MFKVNLLQVQFIKTLLKKILTLFEYEKASNSWKRKQEVNIDIPGPVKNFLMVTLLYSNDKLGCLISTRAKSYKCIFE